VWFELAYGAASRRKGDLAMALKRFSEVKKVPPPLSCSFNLTKHFNDFVEDQYDFHQYCMKKMTMRSYVE
jgi:N-alpha-acetyltransferase 15/16, NatA auxiliary subunit